MLVYKSLDLILWEFANTTEPKSNRGLNLSSVKLYPGSLSSAIAGWFTQVRCSTICQPINNSIKTTRKCDALAWLLRDAKYFQSPGFCRPCNAGHIIIITRLTQLRSGLNEAANLDGSGGCLRRNSAIVPQSQTRGCKALPSIG